MEKGKTGWILAILAAVVLTGCSQAAPAGSSVQAENTVQEVSADQQTQNKEYRTLKIDEKAMEIYTYEDMEADLDTLERAYSAYAAKEVIGTTADGRNIYDLVIGDKTAPEHIIIHGSIHAREYMTTKLVMRQASDFLYALSTDSGEFRGKSIRELAENTAIHVIPMVNPDGVTLAQSGISGIKTDEVKNKIAEIVKSDGYTVDSFDFSQWKANAEGIDLNRNFDAKWDEFAGSAHPSSDRYKGTAPGCAAESKALIELTENNPVKRTVSYHCMGSVIYWYFGQSGELLETTKKWAEDLGSITGYPPEANYQELDPAGYKDWAVSKLGIPSVTIETGRNTVPVPQEQFAGITEENKDVWAETLYNMKEE